MNDGFSNVFIHESELQTGNGQSYVGQLVEYDIEIQDDGRRKATNVIAFK